MPLLEGAPKLLTLFASYRKNTTVAACIDPDVAITVELESMPTREVMQPASIHLEIVRPSP